MPEDNIAYAQWDSIRKDMESLSSRVDGLLHDAPGDAVSAKPDSQKPRIYSELPTEPPAKGYHRIVRTYDDLVPVAWMDVPDGQSDPMPMYLSTEAARIYMMTDEEYERAYPDRQELDWPDSAKKRERPSDATQALVRLLVVTFVSMFLVTIVSLFPDGMSDLRFALSVTVLIAGAVAAGVVGGRFALSRWPREGNGGLPGDASDEEPPSANDLSGALESYAGLRAVGWLAERGRRQAELLESREVSARKTVDETFERGSLSWQRFSGTLDMVHDAVSGNLSVLRDGLRPFDDDPSQRDESKAQLFTESVAGLLDDNDALLGEMENLEAELSRLRFDSLSEDSEDALEEARRLVSDTHHYRRVGSD